MAVDKIIHTFSRVYIDNDVVGSLLAKRILKTFPSDKVSFVSCEPHKERLGDLSPEEFNASKKELFITDFKGKFFKRCPGARPGLTCCNYFVLNLGLQCHMNCSYCYLQSFINTPVSKLFSNIDTALSELELLRHDLSEQGLRIGTGEVIDSLALDPISLYSHKLIEFFQTVPRWRLEFKTKTDFVDQFIEEPHVKNVIVSWSINPQYIIEREEHGTASLAARLAAAERVRNKNFIVSFHIDPMIWHPEWKENYQALVEDICQRFSPDDIPYISVGALRFQPEQRHMMRERFGLKSLVTQAEVFPGSDGKLRYDRALREEMFKFVIDTFKHHNPRWNVFMCMESPETWLGATAGLPTKESGLKELFDHRVIQKTKSL
jgi:spore photoproduct lyase